MRIESFVRWVVCGFEGYLEELLGVVDALRVQGYRAHKKQPPPSA